MMELIQMFVDKVHGSESPFSKSSDSLISALLISLIFLPIFSGSVCTLRGYYFISRSFESKRKTDFG